MYFEELDIYARMNIMQKQYENQLKRGKTSNYSWYISKGKKIFKRRNKSK